MKKKGFTLIELLAVIIILAIIALIAVPQIIKILNKARKSAAEDTVYGIVKSVDTYVASFMLQNNGSFPREVLEFTCNSDGCSLNENTINNLNNYDITNLESLDFKGTKPTSGTIRVSDNGKMVNVSDLVTNGYICNYNEEKAECFKISDAPHYGFGNYGTDNDAFIAASTIDYTQVKYPNDSQAKVFVKLEGSQKSVCMIYNGTLECFKNNNYENEQAHLQTVFVSGTCTQYSPNYDCLDSAFSCRARSDGGVSCFDFSTHRNCGVNAYGSVYCG